MWTLLKAWYGHLSSSWLAIQITHFGGKCSIERMLALDEYTRSTSLTRVLLVIIGTPLPTITLALCQESVPLQAPTAGWSVNIGFWIRVGILGAVAAFAGSTQVGYLLDDAKLSMRQRIAFSISLGVGYIATTMVVAAWVFPVPFTTISLIFPWSAVFVVAFCGVSGVSSSRQILAQREQLGLLNKFSSVQMTLIMIYPAYQALFNVVNHTTYELPVLLVLPLLKLVLKIVFASTLLHKEDAIPEEVIFTIDFFDALYLATFMQTISTRTLVVLIVVNILQSAMELYELHEKTRGMLQRIQNAAGKDIDCNDLLADVRALCRRSNSIRNDAGIKVRSCVVHQLSPEATKELEAFQCQSISVLPATPRPRSMLVPNVGSFRMNYDIGISKRKINWCSAGRKRMASVVPTGPSDNADELKLAWRSHSIVGDQILLQEALETLFTAECLVLTEYLEAFVPTLYGGFVVAMVHLPSAHYHTELNHVTSSNVKSMVQKVFIYALLELLSFVAFEVIMRRRFGIRVLHQLAFVLETQVTFVQSRLMMYMLWTLTYRVVHFGADFSFQFAWMKAT